MTAKLATLQRDMIDFILQSPIPAPGMHRIAAEVVSTPKLAPEQRLHVYHYGYRARLVEVMQDVFERTWAYLGDDGFDAAAHGFIEFAPSSGRTLNRFGETFATWLTSEYPNDIEVAEIAMIDWMMRVAFDGLDMAPISSAALAQLKPEDWATVGFDFHPTVALSPITHNAASIWESLERGETPPNAMRLLEETFLLAWRKDVRSHFVTVGSVERIAIELLRGGASFAETCDRLSGLLPDEEIPAAMGSWLRRWLSEEMLIGLRTD